MSRLNFVSDNIISLHEHEVPKVSYWDLVTVRRVASTIYLKWHALFHWGQFSPKFTGRGQFPYIKSLKHLLTAMVRIENSFAEMVIKVTTDIWAFFTSFSVICCFIL